MLGRAAVPLLGVVLLALVAVPLVLPSALAQDDRPVRPTSRVVDASDGSSTGAPRAALVSRAGHRVPTNVLTSSDRSYARTAAATKTPYQRFEVEVSDANREDSLLVTWEGRVPEDLEVVMSIWDVRAEAWETIASEPGDDQDDTTLEGKTRVAQTLHQGRAQVLVHVRDEPAGSRGEKPDGEFQDPDAYDFSIAWMTDTQYLSQGQAAGDERFGQAYRDITGWIVDNAQQRKIAYAAHTGDIINNWGNHQTHSEAGKTRARAEFRFARRTMDELAEAGVPFGVTPGNHDHTSGTSSRLYNRYFAPSYFNAAEESADTGEDGRGYYGGPWQQDDNQNHYDLVEAAGEELIFLYLGYMAGGKEMRWANDVLVEHSDRKAVILTHSYLKPSHARNGRGGERTTHDGGGRTLFNRVVMPNDNVFLTLSGHTHGVALNIRRDVGPEDRDVVEMLANYQSYEVDGERRTGFLRLLQFDTGDSTMAVDTYSPTLDDHNADEFDTRDGRYDARADEFTIPVDLTSRPTSFATDRLALRVASTGPADRAQQ